MDVGGSRLARNGVAEGVVWNIVRFQIASKPQAFGCVRKERDIHPVAVVETQRLVNGSLTVRADRQGFAEMLLVSQQDPFEIVAGERPLPVEALHDWASHRRCGSLAFLSFD